LDKEILNAKTREQVHIQGLGIGNEPSLAGFIMGVITKKPFSEFFTIFKNPKQKTNLDDINIL
jgi:hypothetical protein